MKGFCYILILICIFCGCSDLLEKNPPSKPSENTFWKQKSDLDMALTACYGTMTKFDGTGYFSFATPMWDSFVDNGRCETGRTFDVFYGNIDPSMTGIVSNIYPNAYVGITRMNLFLSQLGKYENLDISDEERDFYEGQVLFLRAFYYSHFGLMFRRSDYLCLKCPSFCALPGRIVLEALANDARQRHQPPRVPPLGKLQT